MGSRYSRKNLLKLLILFNLLILIGLSYYGEKNKVISNEIVLSSFSNSLFNRDIRIDTLGARIDKAELVGVYVDNKLYGYLANSNEAESLIEKIGEINAKNINISKENIEGINIKGEINFKKNIVDIDKIDTVETIANKIVDKSNLSIDLITKDVRNISIKPKLEIIDTNDLALGFKEIKEGEDGLKKQELELTYRNGQLYNESVLSENIVSSSKNKIIYNGTGNPVLMGVSFLKNPTTKEGVVTSEFGVRWGKMHKGVDIGNELGKPVYAAFDGKVKNVFYDQLGYGKAIIIEHDKGLETRYAHLNSYNVKIGDKVLKGEKIGEVGNTGRSTGPHLHFELRCNGNPVNPMKYIE